MRVAGIEKEPASSLSVSAAMPVDSPAMSLQTEHEELPIDDDSRSLAERRPRRRNRLLPKRYRDNLPQPAPSLPPANHLTDPTNSPVLASYPNHDLTSNIDPRSLRSRVRKVFRTRRNIFGLVRQYFCEQLPAADPEEFLTLADLSSTPVGLSTDIASHAVCQTTAPFYPFPNESSFRLGQWYWNGGVQKSQQNFKDLIDIVGDPNFDPSDVRNTKWKKINTTLGDNVDDDAAGEWMDEDAGWKKSRIQISVPFHRRMKDPGPRNYVCADLYHRSLVEVITERIKDPHAAVHFHLEPYKLLWKPTNQHEEVRLHGEIYTSEAFLQAHDALQESPGEPDCDLPRVIVALMFWSDATHLTSFGNSQLWPLYLFIGNESKYRRCKPSCNSCSHVAYFQHVSGPLNPKQNHAKVILQLPDQFKHFAAQHTGGKGPKQPLITHCRRELFHEQVNVVLDDEFIHAYQHGIVITCCDGIKRRFYPRIFTYSADYPEKSADYDLLMPSISSDYMQGPSSQHQEKCLSSLPDTQRPFSEFRNDTRPATTLNFGKG
jgi:hypothetical protein